MLQTTLVALAVLAVILLIVIKTQYLAIGQWLYQNATDMEAKFRGFEQSTVDIGEMSLAMYSNTDAKDKPVLLLLHGYSSDKDVWVRFARHFIADYRVIIPDLAGHGDSPYNPEWDYSIPSQAKRVEALLDKLDIAQAHVVGSSMGGFLTATFAIEYPQRVLSATMIDPAGVEAPELSPMAKQLMAGNNPFLVKSRADFDRFYAMTMMEPPIVPDMVLEAVSQIYIEGHDRLAKIFADFYGSDYLDNQLHRLTVPALLWWGEKDQVIDVSSVSVWQKGVPNLQVEIWEGIGHLPMMERPNQAAEKYRQFLEQL